MKSTTHTQPRGVILLEAIVAVGVLIAVIGAVLGLTLRASNATRAAIDQVVATYLAQDMAEWLVAKKRYNDREGNGWAGLIDTGNLGISTNTTLDGALTACSGLNNCNLYRAPTGMYTHDLNGGVNAITPFQRSVTMSTTLPGPDAVEYVITVSWYTGSHTESFVMRTTLYK